MRYRLFNLASGIMIESWESEHRFSSGRVTKNGQIFHFAEVNKAGNSRFNFYEIQTGDTSGFEVLREARSYRLYDDGGNMGLYFRDGGFSVYSVDQEEPIYEYKEVAGGVQKEIAMSPDGKKVAMAIEETDRVDIIVVDLLMSQRRVIKTYPMTEANVGLSFTDDAQSLIVFTFTGRSLGASRSLDLVDIQSGATVDIRPDSDGFWGGAELFLNNGLMIVRGGKGIWQWPRIRLVTLPEWRAITVRCQVRA